jgi:hypothetical protein
MLRRLLAWPLTNATDVPTSAAHYSCGADSESRILPHRLVLSGLRPVLGRPGGCPHQVVKEILLSGDLRDRKFDQPKVAVLDVRSSLEPRKGKIPSSASAFSWPTNRSFWPAGTTVLVGEEEESTVFHAATSHSSFGYGAVVVVMVLVHRGLLRWPHDGFASL